MICRNQPQAKIWPLSLPTKPLLIAVPVNIKNCKYFCLFFQAHVVSAFEHSLGNMTSRLEQLNDTSNRKVNNTSNLILNKSSTKLSTYYVRLFWVKLVICFVTFEKFNLKVIPSYYLAVLARVWNYLFLVSDCKFGYKFL